MNDRDDFYVGYLPMPASHRRLAHVVVPLIMWLLVAVMGVCVLFQRDPGPAVWDLSAEQTWEGTLYAEPYPMLVSTSERGVRVQLITGELKNSVHDRIRPLDGQRARLAGFPLERDGRSMIQLSPAEDAIGSLAGAVDSKPDLRPLADVELVGEIVDGKCFYGAMKPGNGRAHKACAILCIDAGLPAMFVSTDTAGKATFWLLTFDGRAEFPTGLRELVAEPVRVRGRASMLGDLHVLDVSLGGVRAL
ncbi:MAG: hypothetical protein AAGD00_06775 [Planctomycetota bacterium]